MLFPNIILHYFPVVAVPVWFLVCTFIYLTRFASGKNMPVKFIGRKGFDRGNTLFWYAAHLKDLGVRRTFVLTKELDTYPEKCYYKPTRVAPNFSDPSVGQMFKLMNCHYLHHTC